MFSFILLILIYLCFISLGLQDSLFGAAWPSMYESINVPHYYAGIVSMIGAAMTVIAAVFSVYIIKRFTSGKVVIASVILTAAALLGFSFSHSFIYLCLLIIPLGLGSGSVDAALNNYIAMHYKARHMSWLHCFWGLGASAGPLIMSFFLLQGNSWHSGYRTISVIQFSLVLLLLFSFPLWKMKIGESSEQKKENDKQADNNPVPLKKIFSIAGVKEILLAFFSYCSIEIITGLWGTSFMVIEKGIPPETAAQWISLFFIGITSGRFLSGFLTIKLNNRQMVRIGQFIIGIAVIVFFLPFTNAALRPAFFLTGFGCAPIFPSLLHQTPVNFGRENSKAIVGIQMGCAYIGNTVIPPAFGWLTSVTSFKILPVILGLMLILNIIMVELVNRKVDKNKNTMI